MKFKNKDITKPILSLVVISFLLIFPSPLIQADCSFWAALSKDGVPKEVITRDLLDSANSLKSLAKQNDDGWGIAYYENGEIFLLKGGLPADRDYLYNESVKKVAHKNLKIVTAHVRKATSGCYDGVPNPHPFKRTKGGKNWLFGHNGVIGKSTLISLIGEEYLESNSPQTCPDNPPDSWVGSELYFIFLLKNIEENGWDVQAGIRQAINTLLTNISDSDKGFNFFLSDGETIWAFRKGRPLYYYEQANPRYSVVASKFTAKRQDGWIEVPEGSLVVIREDTPVEVIQIYAPVASRMRTSCFAGSRQSPPLF